MSAQRVKHPALITRLRKERGMSERQLGIFIGMNPTKINLSMHGHRDMSLHEIRDIASALHVDWWKLLPVFGEEYRLPFDTSEPTAPRPIDHRRSVNLWP